MSTGTTKAVKKKTSKSKPVVDQAGLEPPGSRQASRAIAVQPLRRRPVLFWGLLAVFALWVAVLLVLYFTTVYPG